MIMAIFGYLVLDVVFLINSFWFHQLRVRRITCSMNILILGNHLLYVHFDFRWNICSLSASKTSLGATFASTLLLTLIWLTRFILQQGDCIIIAISSCHHQHDHHCRHFCFYLTAHFSAHYTLFVLPQSFFSHFSCCVIF